MVPYTGRRRPRPVTPYQMIRAAGKYTWANRRDIARKIRKARMKWRKVGGRAKKTFAPMPSAPKRAKTFHDPADTGVASLNMRTLYQFALPNPNTSTSNEYNARDSASVYYSGYKICRYFENIGNGIGEKYEVHYAIAQLRNLDDLGSSWREAFFRDNSSSTTRTSDFINASTTSTVLWDAKYNCLPLNTEHPELKIIKHKKKVLMPKLTDQINKNTWKVEFWLPIKRNMVFNSRGNVYPTHPFVEMYWYQSTTPLDWAAANPGPGNVQNIQTWNVNRLYFRDVPRK